MEKNKEKEFENFRKEIFGLRKANKWTQKQVADALGITAPSYQAYEAGEALPTLLNFVKLAKLFEISPDELLGWDEF